jgi:hypothetical protein
MHDPIEVGREYELLPFASHHLGRSALWDDEVTRVCVNRGQDSDGNYRVTALDGDHPGHGRYLVQPGYLAALAN